MDRVFPLTTGVMELKMTVLVTLMNTAVAVVLVTSIIIIIN